MTPLTWKYKLALIITAARQALGAFAGALSWEQSCPLTLLHFSWFKGFSPRPSLGDSPAWGICSRSRILLLPLSLPGTSGVTEDDASDAAVATVPARQSTGVWGEARALKYHLPPPGFYSQSSETLLIFFVFSQSIFKMGVKDTPGRDV